MKRYHKEIKGIVDLLHIDQNFLKDTKKRRKNVTMVLIDYKI